jgi:hypothetical protein
LCRSRGWETGSRRRGSGARCGWIQTGGNNCPPSTGGCAGASCEQSYAGPGQRNPHSTASCSDGFAPLCPWDIAGTAPCPGQPVISKTRISNALPGVSGSAAHSQSCPRLSSGSRQARGRSAACLRPGTRVTRLAPSPHAIRLAGPPPASRRFGRVAYCLAGSWVAVW